MRGLILFVFLFALLPRAAGAGDWSQTWFTLDTPHFQVHYYKSPYQDLSAIAQKAAHAAEHAHHILAPVLRHWPRDKTHIVVTDQTDSANGSAQIQVRNVIHINATAPESLSGLDDYDDWITALIIHEYAHILHIDTIWGLPRLFNTVFGKQWVPNQAQPRWFTEGLATYHESAQTTAGRVRSTIYDMYLRSAVVENKFLRLDQLSSSVEIYPRGLSAYLYGSRFLDYLGNTYGPERLTQLSHIYGGRGSSSIRSWTFRLGIPYLMNQAAKQVYGRSYDELYREFHRSIDQKYRQQVSRVVQFGLTHAASITSGGENMSSPRISPDGQQVVFLYDDVKSTPQVALYNRRDKTIRHITRTYGTSAAELSPDGKTIYFDHTSIWKTFYSFRDLFSYSLSDGKLTQLTFGQRVRDPTVSPDGKIVYYVSNDPRSQKLVAYDVNARSIKTLLTALPHQQLYTPRVSPDGTKIVYSSWTDGGYRDLFILDRRSGKVTSLWKDRAIESDPIFSASGQQIYFSSDRSGIFNVYNYDLNTHTIFQVTNVIGGAFSPTVDHLQRDLYFIGYSSVGYNLQHTQLSAKKPTALAPPQKARPEAVPIQTTRPYPGTNYSPWKTLRPYTWSMSLGISSDLSVEDIVISTEGSDIAGHHGYSIDLVFDPNQSAYLTTYPGFRFGYQYGRFWPSFSFDTSRAEMARGFFLNGKTYAFVEETYALGLGTSLPLWRALGRSISLSLGYRGSWRKSREEIRSVVEPNTPKPRLPDFRFVGGINTTVGYQSVESYPQSISRERGRSVSLSLRTDHRIFGSRFNRMLVSWQWNEYWPMPWRKHHVVAFAFQGGVGKSNDGSYSLFSIGGFPEQNLLRAVIDDSAIGGLFLRGYPPGSASGDQFYAWSAEYRFPIWSFERGYSTWPIYLNRAFGAAFSDVGFAFVDALKAEQIKFGAGAELWIEGTIFYVVPLSFRFSYARGFLAGGGNQFHILLSQAF